jgi:hypothetical protein
LGGARALGIDEQKQRRRIAKDALFQGCLLRDILAPEYTVRGSQVRQAFFLRWGVVHLWLARISAARVKPEIRDRLIAYQLECAEVLADHFAGRAAQPLAQPLLPPRRFQLSEQGRANFLAKPMWARMKRLEYCGNRAFGTYEAWCRALEVLRMTDRTPDQRREILNNALAQRPDPRPKESPWRDLQGLTWQEDLFVSRLDVGADIGEAYIAAGFKSPSMVRARAAGRRLLRKPYVKAELDRRVEAKGRMRAEATKIAIEHSGITQARVAVELGRIGFGWITCGSTRRPAIRRWIGRG